ncbi:DUF551 domain-containing protein [Parabacteroides sp. CH2-D42-20]|uniref:DUF551 domain-containing protein n=1 Tax=Parabacteroides sp. CH2-D42-20 TaxID=2320086 RepID=UPI001F2864BD|nr:DUF551 domain-containing protein [Parabacteroides sp. CH2-D42-20]
MRQTIEEAAKEYLSQFPWEEGDKLAYHICEFDFKAGFKAGAEWQANQSPWVSVKERLPENQDIVLVRGEYGGKATAYLHGEYSGFIVYGEDAYKVFGEITHWMPIPDLEE